MRLRDIHGGLRGSAARAVIVAIAVTAMTMASACGHPEPSFTAEPGVERKALPYALSPPKLDSRKLARWWSLPDGGVPGQSEYYPCSDCHDEDMEVNPKRRELSEEHGELQLKHGGQNVWCLSCHHAQDRDSFTDGAGAVLAAERPDRVCVRCHAREHRDFEHGIHGKRMNRFVGERILAPCVGCHDPHAPGLTPRKPLPPPTGRRSAGSTR